MTDSVVYFGEVMAKAAEIVATVSPDLGKPLVIRDVYGLVSLAFNFSRAEHREEIAKLEAQIGQLGRYAGKPGVICADDLFDADEIFTDPSIIELVTVPSGGPLRVLERQVTGQDWLSGVEKSSKLTVLNRIPHIVFFGLKGGVGRSTALAITAYQLAKLGRRVLLIDLDLESPGLSGLLVPPDKLADFGVVDWLVEDAVGQGTEVAGRMVSTSPLSDDLRHDIRVAAAIGRDDRYYLDKLSRAYADVAVEARPKRLSERVLRLIGSLVEDEKPDVVLIDSRAGLHDLAALSIVGLASTALLFSTDTAQAWQGYRSLFKYWQLRPEVARSVRERLKMVSALFPESDQVVRSKGFLERSYLLFADTLYDEMEAGAPAQEGQDLFNFDLEDISAPHYPLPIKWSSRLQEFDPLQIPRGLFTEDEIRAAYGGFLDGLVQFLDSADSE